MRVVIPASALRTRAEAPWDPALLLPALVVSRYLFFLTRRPISRSNTHYVLRRIDGLQSLAGVFEAAAHPRAAMTARLLRSMNPGNLPETAERLQQTLAPLVQTTFPRGYIAGDAAPPPDFLRDARRMLLVLGPAIGIGDEIMTFPLPRWIKAAVPGAEITVLSAYEGLWNRVAGVDRVERYHEYLSLLHAMRGESALGAFDLVALIDFENPELHQAVAREERIPRYVELSIGAHVMVAVDNRRRWIHRVAETAPAFGNYYHGFARLARGLGVSPATADLLTVVARRAVPDPAILRIYVSPFTSKYDPSPRYWSQLVAAVVPADAGRPVRVVLDPGPNLTTRRFASDVARAAAGRHPGFAVRFEVAAAGEARGLPLDGVFAELEEAHAVICADSFTAHAAPTLGCTTLVLAAPGLEDWRVPSAASYYFSDEAPLDDVAAGMRQVLARRGIVPLADLATPPISDVEVGLVAAERALERVVDGTSDGGFPALCDSYDRFVGAYRAVVERLPAWPRGARGVLADTVYDAAHRELNGERPVPAELRGDVARHVEDAWREWRTTNLSKFLALMVERTDA